MKDTVGERVRATLSAIIDLQASAARRNSHPSNTDKASSSSSCELEASTNVDGDDSLMMDVSDSSDMLKSVGDNDHSMLPLTVGRFAFLDQQKQQSIIRRHRQGFEVTKQ